MKLTDQQKIDITNKYKNGSSLRNLAKEYNVSKTSIFSILKVRNIKREE